MRYLVRLIFATLMAGGTAYLVAFAVAEYVVKANTTSLTTALDSLQSSNSLAITNLRNSIDALNSSLTDNVSAIKGLSDQVSSLSADSTVQLVRLDTLKEDVAKVQDAIQDAGIPIRASYQPLDLTSADWKKIQANIATEPGQPILIDPVKWSEALKDLKDGSQ
jgi:TolA-binding protein